MDRKITFPEPALIGKDKAPWGLAEWMYFSKLTQARAYESTETCELLMIVRPQLREILGSKQAGYEMILAQSQLDLLCRLVKPTGEEQPGSLEIADELPRMLRALYTAELYTVPTVATKSNGKNEQRDEAKA